MTCRHKKGRLTPPFDGDVCASLSLSLLAQGSFDPSVSQQGFMS